MSEQKLKLSIVMPAYNEEKYITTIIERVLAVELENIEKEIIIVDDCSRDKTVEIVKKEYGDHSQITLYQHEENAGKGAALKTGFSKVTGDIIIIQDADLEYSPTDYPILLGPILDDVADVVYGSRFLGGPHRVLMFWHSLGNKFLTFLSNMFNNLNLTDMETCYKVFRREVIQEMDIKSKRFGVEPEMTAKIARRQWRIFEVPISYWGRTYEEGKKITWKDGIVAIYAIIRFALFD